MVFQDSVPGGQSGLERLVGEEENRGGRWVEATRESQESGEEDGKGSLPFDRSH
jgi:hypothetical protein